jgi:hypothetical protein
VLAIDALKEVSEVYYILHKQGINWKKIIV